MTCPNCGTEVDAYQDRNNPHWQWSKPEGSDRWLDPSGEWGCEEKSSPDILTRA